VSIGRLLEITVADLALIDRLRLELAPGLNVFTGETGAGKSLLIDALGLATGARADTALVRHGAETARVTALFDRLPEPLIDQPATDSIEMAESLSMAFLHVLETLSPVERVAFLLREIFDVSYAEVAAILETTETNSRQLVTRARKHVREKRPRFTVDRERHAAVLRRFLTACASGDLTELVTQLKDDVIVYTDGGGKGAVPNPIYGVDKVTRLLLGLARKAPPGLSGGYMANVNGEPGFVFTLDGKINSVLTLDLTEDGRIRTVFLVVNPDKLPKGSISES